MSQLLRYLRAFRRVKLFKALPKIANYIRYRFSKKQVIIQTDKFTPQIGSLFITSRCNLNCEYCNAGKIIKEDWPPYEASLEKVKQIMVNSLFANCLMIDLLGGEPLLVKELAAIIKFLNKTGHITNISTNGLLLLERIEDLKSVGISQINLSIYDDNWKVIERDLEIINSIFPVYTSMVLMRSMLKTQADKILERAQFIRKAGSIKLRFHNYRPMGKNPDVEEVIEKNDPFYMDFKKRLNSVLPGFCQWPEGVNTNKGKKVCADLWQRIGCDMKGNMIICSGVDHYNQGLNQNLFISKPDIILNDPVKIEMRKKLLDASCDPPGVCKTCNFLGNPGL